MFSLSSLLLLFTHTITNTTLTHAEVYGEVSE